MRLPTTIRNPDRFFQYKPAGFDGVFDWSWTNGCFGETKITPMDFDGVVERKRNFLIFESKGSAVPLPKGQEITLRTLHATGIFTVFIIQGKERPDSFEVWHPGCKKIPSFSGLGVETAKNKVTAWYQWADKNPASEAAYDDIEYFNERAAILEYEANYSREEAEKEARKMMIERRLLLNKTGT